MSLTFNDVSDDLSKLTEFIKYYTDELKEAKVECRCAGNIEKNLRELPGHTEHRFGQLQEIEAVLQLLELEHRKERQTQYKKFLEGYNRALSSRDAEKYADATDDVIYYAELINHVSLLRNKYLGILKGLESKNFQLGHISRLRCAGLEDASL